MKHLISLLLALLPLALSAKNYEIRPDRAIQAIINSSEANVELIQSPSDRIVYSSDEIEAPLKIYVKSGGTLIIETKRKNNYKVSKVKVYYSGNITDIKNSGTGDVKANKINTPGILKLYNSGTGDIEISHLNVKKVNIFNSGTGDVEINHGKTIELHIANSGTGDVEAKINSSTASIANSGTGDVTSLPQSSSTMSVANSGVGKVVIKKKSNGGNIAISPKDNRNIRIVR
ncbi:MAG: DUF4097 domain-containing protein [Bacteroides sp.]|nr:DUF4097 domain-containing protein [Bacteroides sp.]